MRDAAAVATASASTALSMLAPAVASLSASCVPVLQDIAIRTVRRPSTADTKTREREREREREDKPVRNGLSFHERRQVRSESWSMSTESAMEQWSLM